MKFFPHFLTLTASILLLNPACEKTSTTGSKTYSLQAFAAVEFDPDFKGAYHIELGASPSVVITCDNADWLSGFQVSVDFMGQLTISYSGSLTIDWSGVNIQIITPNPVTPPANSGDACDNAPAMNTSESCYVVINGGFFSWSCNNIKNLRLDVNIDNSGGGMAQSSSSLLNNLCINKSGSGAFNAAVYKAKNAAVRASAGDVTVWATEAVFIENSGGGTIRYGGNPLLVTIKNTGGGKVEQM